MDCNDLGDVLLLLLDDDLFWVGESYVPVLSTESDQD